MDALKQGFQEIFPLDTLKMFDEQELEVRHIHFIEYTGRENRF